MRLHILIKLPVPRLPYKNIHQESSGKNGPLLESTKLTTFEIYWKKNLHPEPLRLVYVIA